MRKIFIILPVAAISVAHAAETVRCNSNPLAVAISTPKENFEFPGKNGDATTAGEDLSPVVYDASTGLMWTRCELQVTTTNANNTVNVSYGNEYSTEYKTCSGTPTQMTWSEALNFVKDYGASEYAGYNGWRLPNVKELASIVENHCYNPSLNLAVFPGGSPVQIWTNTPDKADAASSIWSVNFNYGGVAQVSQASAVSVRLVRNHTPAP